MENSSRYASCGKIGLKLAYGKYYGRQKCLSSRNFFTHQPDEQNGLQARGTARNGKCARSRTEAQQGSGMFRPTKERMQHIIQRINGMIREDTTVRW
ncbi:hypothetical protein KCP76_21415 [Salmonella enterica subsp. enterica serovar Weltevreden]|nr:hypothetical protein KCP76_21415 [Salmonella enterica subsp. enterica serovar Weltevreden]